MPLFGQDDKSYLQSETINDPARFTMKSSQVDQTMSRAQKIAALEVDRV